MGPARTVPALLSSVTGPPEQRSRVYLPTDAAACAMNVATASG